MENSKVNLMNATNKHFFFYNELKNKNINLILHLKDEVNLYDEIITYINENCFYNYVATDLINFYKKKKMECEKKIKSFTILKNNIDDKIYYLCDHHFITDIIDFDIDKSKEICYCSICNLTKRENLNL
jgi:hypothetical protein